MGTASETIRLLAELHRAVRTLETTNSLSRGSIVNGGSIVAYNQRETPALIVGEQYDGSIVAAPVSGTLPPRPSQPSAEPALYGARVNWDGMYFDGPMVVAPMDFSRIEIHACPSADYVPETTATLVGTYETPRGGLKDVPVPGSGPKWIKLVTRSLSGRRSVSSVGTEVTPQVVGDVIETSDGDAPTTSPNVLLRGGIGALFASWTAISNADPVTYEVHLFEDDATTEPTPGDVATMVAETPATSLTIRTKPGGGPLLSTSIYTAWVIAKDADGPADPGLSSSAALMLVTAADIAVDYAYVGDLLANQITGGTMNATVLLAGLFQTATSGGRTEVGPFGIRIYDANGVDVNVDLNGILNRFRGSIDATDIIIRDALQMFGKLNKMGPGSILTLTSTTSAPSQAPTMTWEYEERARPGGGAFITGTWWSADESQSSATEVFFKSGWIQRQGVPWPIPTVTVAPGDVWSERMPWSSCRIAEVVGNGLMATFHDKRANGDTGFPKRCVGVWDDAAVPSSGAAILKGELEVEPFNWFRNIIACPRLHGGAGRNTFAAMIWDSNTKAIEWRDYAYTTAGGLVLTGYSGAGVISTAAWASDEKLVAAEFGTTTALGIPDGGVVKTAIVLHTNKNNYVYFYNGAAYVLQPDCSWPTTYGDQQQIFRSYNPYNNTLTSMMSANWAAGADQKIYRYTNNYAAGSDTWWASFAWRGEATKVYRTEDSARASIAYRRRARLRLSVPALPAPAAGVGAARDPLKDPYGWIYYLGHGAVEPVDAAMYLQPVQPTMVAGVVLADSSIAKSDYPTWSGTNPNSASTFPASSPAQIRSDGNDSGGDPLLSIDGAGHIRGQDLWINTAQATALTGKAFRQMAFVERARQVLIGGGKRTVVQSTGKVYWPTAFQVIGAGNHPDTALSGLFTISYPTAGTSIPVHNSSVRSSVVAAADGIPLGGDEALYYELPLEAASTSQPGRFHVVGWNSNDGFLPPLGWVLICIRTTAFPYFKWGDGTTDTGWIYAALTGAWIPYDTTNYVPGTGLRVRAINGIVHLESAVKSGAANSTIATLGSDWWPTSVLSPVGRSSDGVSYDGPDATQIGKTGILTASARTNYRFMNTSWAL